MVDVPEGVPWEPPPPLLPPPPQDAINTTAREVKAKAASAGLRLVASSIITNSPKRTTSATGPRGKFVRGRRLAVDRAVVVTFTWKAVGVEPTVSEPGTEQVAATGAPVQVRVTFPLKPAPPIIRLKLAICPAETVAAEELPGARVKPNAETTPLRVTVCGLLLASSINWTDAASEFEVLAL